MIAHLGLSGWAKVIAGRCGIDFQRESVSGRAHHPRGHVRPPPARPDFVGGLDHVLVGEDVAVGADDDTRAEVGYLARTRIQAVAKEIAEDRILQCGVNRAAYFLLGKDVDHRRNDLLCGRREGIGSGQPACLSSR
jgi:hypothetical protein